MAHDERLSADAEHVGRLIYIVRGQKVMLDSDLAALYGVPTFRLNEQVKRNRPRFPEDFMIRLTKEDVSALTSQIAILEKKGRGQHRKYLPHAFTELGVAMLSSVLRSERAVQVNIAIMRAFVRLREALAARKGLAGRLDAIERQLAWHEGRLGAHAGQIKEVFGVIRRLMAPPERPKRRIGFVPSASDP